MGSLTVRRTDGQKDQHTEIPTERRTDYKQLREITELVRIIKNYMGDTGQNLYETTNAGKILKFNKYVYNAQYIEKLTILYS